MAGSSRLEPGASGAIRVVFDTGGRIGRIVRTIDVFTNDPEKPKVVLTLKAGM